MTLPQDIVDRLAAQFPADGGSAALSHLNSIPQVTPRVARCVVHLANGDLDRLAHFAEAARLDPRDVIFWAEYEDHIARHPRLVRNVEMPFDEPSVARPATGPDAFGAGATERLSVSASHPEPMSHINRDRMQTLADYQDDMRRGYLWGATGIMTSGLVWLMAGSVAYLKDPRAAIWVLFIGAGFIVPVSNLVDRLLGAPGKHASGNRLSVLALETTVLMLMCLPLAYGLSLYRIEWFFPAVLMIIGGRYLTFATIYGTPIYWALGGLLGLAALLTFFSAAPPHQSALLGGAIELVFGAALLVAKRR